MKRKEKRNWLKWLVIFITLLVIIFIVLFIIENQSSVGSISREVICNNEKASCDNNCDTKFVSYFCKKDCAKQWQICMGYG